MRVFVQTRGRTLDYRFLGLPPAELWWLKFQPYTSFEKPTLIVSSDGRRWRAYFSGISSARLDRDKATIRYSLALEDAARDSVNEAAKLVAAWVADAASQAEPGAVQVALDAALPEEDVERLLGDSRSPTA